MSTINTKKTNVTTGTTTEEAITQHQNLLQQAKDAEAKAAELKAGVVEEHKGLIAKSVAVLAGLGVVMKVEEGIKKVRKARGPNKPKVSTPVPAEQSSTPAPVEGTTVPSTTA